MAAKLKVYRTAIGFHDAYVAAASQKAALAAWGTDKPLFARGAAEVVTDPELTEAPLAHPGTVIKLPRGTAEEHVAALPVVPPASETGSSKAPKPAKAKTTPAREPKPSRAALDEAEAAIAAKKRAQAAEIDAIEAEERALRDRRRAVERQHEQAIKRLRERRDQAEAAYQSAVKRWQG